MVLQLQRRGGLRLCCGCGGSAAAAVVCRGGGDAEPGAKKKTGGPRQVSWAQVEAMTGGFTSGVVGEGGSSTVYIGWVGLGQQAAAAVKVVQVHSSSSRSSGAFRRELQALLRARHPHIVRLLAFSSCDADQHQAALVLELAPNGTLHDHLHQQKQVLSIMSWPRRVSLALQVARALEYLHHRCDPQVVHGDVKASNVLLDAAMDARLCDFGSAHAGFIPLTGALLQGSPGYVDPHYLRSGLLTAKSDVYSFGVLLLELLTGLQPSQFQFQFQHARARLLTAALVDRRLGRRYDAAEAAAVLALAAACVGDNPTLRPSMADAVRALERTCQASISAAGKVY